MTEKFLPVGIQDFEKMITSNFLYVDKTRYLHEMARPPARLLFPGSSSQVREIFDGFDLLQPFQRQEGSVRESVYKQDRLEMEGSSGTQDRFQPDELRYS